MNFTEQGEQRTMSMEGPGATVERLLQATNAHDLERLVACFADDYRNETPVHPARDFQGRAQVRRNWEQIFAFVPDIRAEMGSSVAPCPSHLPLGPKCEMRGTRRDGTAHLMRGSIVFGVADAVISWARFYLEPVDENDATVDQAIREQVVRR